MEPIIPCSWNRTRRLRSDAHHEPFAPKQDQLPAVRYEQEPRPTLLAVWCVWALKYFLMDEERFNQCPSTLSAQFRGERLCRRDPTACFACDVDKVGFNTPFLILRQYAHSKVLRIVNRVKDNREVFNHLHP